MKRILVIRDDYYHHATVVDAGLSFLCEDYMVDFVSTAEPGMLKNYNVVILAKDNHIHKTDTSGWFTPMFVWALRGYVENGGGLFVLHAGTVHCKFNPALKALIGSSFKNHPEQCPVTVKIAKNNEITEGFSEFTQTDEHYVLDITADDIEIFLESTSQHFTQPAGYLRNVGFGKVVVLTPGHNLAVFQEPSYQTLISNTVKAITT